MLYCDTICYENVVGFCTWWHNMKIGDLCKTLVKQTIRLSNSVEDKYIVSHIPKSRDADQPTYCRYMDQKQVLFWRSPEG